jgi:ParB family transcriptional regulator, chromosome partitioning protein
VAEQPRGMGRGLAAILSSTSGNGDGATQPELREVPVDLVVPNPRQPRRHFDEEALVGLADSVRVRGVLQPILVRPRHDGSYELIAGERRLRAARLADRERIPAIVQPHDDQSSLELALIENMARQDLNPVEEARACSLLVEELGLSREEVGRRVGRSRVAVSNLLRILDLPDEALELLETRRLTEGHGRALLLAGDHADRRRLALLAAQEGWTVRETEERARRTNPSADASEVEVRAHRRAPARPSADQEAAAAELAEALGRALGHDVSVIPSGHGYRIALEVESHDAAVELAEQLGAYALD